MLGDEVLSPQRLERKIRAEARARQADSLSERLCELALGDDAAEAEADLADAVQSAEEAAAARQRAKGGQPAARPSPEADLPRLSTSGEQVNRYAGTRCEGCGFNIAKGLKMVRGGRGMCHPSPECVALAERGLTEAIAASQERHARGADKHAAGSEKREAQLAHRISDAKCDLVRTCIDGKCRSTECRVYCTQGCGRGVHVVTCLQMSDARAVQGRFKCGECRAFEMAPHSCSPLPTLVREGDRSSLMELALGAEGTAKNHADFARLERLWLADLTAGADGASMADFVLPRHGEESFMAFLRWVVTDAGRAASFSTIWRAASGVMAGSTGPNWSASARVKLLVKELEKSHGVVAVPDTHATRRIVHVMFNEAIDQVVSKRLRVRTRALATLEIMGGVRVGEACGGGDGHGALANNLCLARPVGTGPYHTDETAELWVADSKTLFPRYVNFVGKSRQTGVEGARYVRELWADCGFSLENRMLVESVEDGMTVQRPDYHVLRVSLSDMSTAEVEKLKRALTRTECLELAKHASASLDKLSRRRGAKTRGEEYKYVNVAGGARKSGGLSLARQHLTAQGFGKFLDVVPGPLVRSTHGSLLTHMPLSVDSSYTHLIGALKRAWEISSKMPELDPELDLGGLEEPKWAHHSFRRFADKVARETMKLTGADKSDLDDLFGWKQAERAKDMQLHYAGPRERTKRARVTMMI
jgi:hypothetical protein